MTIQFEKIEAAQLVVEKTAWTYYSGNGLGVRPYLQAKRTDELLEAVGALGIVLGRHRGSFETRETLTFFGDDLTLLGAIIPGFLDLKAAGRNQTAFFGPRPTETPAQPSV